MQDPSPHGPRASRAGVAGYINLQAARTWGCPALSMAWQPRRRASDSPLLAGHSKPNPRQGSAWSLFARISFPPGAVLQHYFHSPHYTSGIRSRPQLSGLENQEADSWLVELSTASLKAKELPQFTPKEGLAQRDKETHCSHSVDIEVGHPGFLVEKHCWHSWKSHLAISLAPMN